MAGAFDSAAFDSAAFDTDEAIAPVAVRREIELSPGAFMRPLFSIEDVPQPVATGRGLAVLRLGASGAGIVHRAHFGRGAGSVSGFGATGAGEFFDQVQSDRNFLEMVGQFT